MKCLLLICAALFLSSCITSSNGGSGTNVYSGKLGKKDVDSKLQDFVTTSIDEPCSKAFHDSLSGNEFYDTIPSRCHDLKGRVQTLYNKNPDTSVFISSSYIDTVWNDFVYVSTSDTADYVYDYGACKKVLLTQSNYAVVDQYKSCPEKFYGTSLLSIFDSLEMNDYENPYHTRDTCLALLISKRYDKNLLPPQCFTSTPDYSLGSYTYNGTHVIYFDTTPKPDTNYNCTEYLLKTGKYNSRSASYSCQEYLSGGVSMYEKNSLTMNSLVDTASFMLDTETYQIQYDDTCLHALVAGKYDKNLIPSQCFSSTPPSGPVFGKYVYEGKQAFYYGGRNDSLKLALIYDTTYSYQKGAYPIFDIPTPTLTVNSKVKAECESPDGSNQYVSDSLFTPVFYVDPAFVMLYPFSGGCNLNQRYKITISN